MKLYSSFSLNAAWGFYFSFFCLFIYFKILELGIDYFRFDCFVIVSYIVLWARTGDSRGFAFVRYKYADEAQKAVDRLDGTPATLSHVV